jgi:DNA adenine methylase
MIYSPLRYPGGKAKLFPFFSQLISRNGIRGVEYFEPYAGGAGLAIRLLTNGLVSRVHLNDLDVAIYAFWKSIIETPAQFCDLIIKTPVTVAEWHAQKDIFSRGDGSSALSLGFSAYFLNRTNRSGIIEGAGPIGGYDQSGAWKIDARLVKQTQIDNIMKLSKFSKQIVLYNLDAIKFIRENILGINEIMYLDPPYFMKGKKLYKNYYNIEDHKLIANEMIKHRHRNWVVSYDDVAQIRQAYESFRPLNYNLNYSAGPKSVGTEIMFLSDAMIPPELAGFKFAA